MKYSVQHNGKGKSHILSDELTLVCNSFGEFNFSDPVSLVFEDGKFYETFEGMHNELSKDLIEFKYCTKCINKIDK